MAKNVHIDGFVAQYAASFKEYELLAEQVRDLIKTILKNKGIMAIVSSRAKDPKRLKTKLEKMDDERVAEGKLPYQSVQEVADSIHDLIGARIALYFPADVSRIQDLLESEFRVQDLVKVFPPRVTDSAKTDERNCTAFMRKKYPQYDTRRFDGYHATHYRVNVKDPQPGAINPDIEVQVASVLMHAWSEVEHDLAYKKMMGEVSREEYECLDEINGLVIAGEIALNRLNQLSQQRIKAQNQISTVFMLKNYLEAWLQQNGSPAEGEEEDPAIRNTGNVELLFKLYQHRDLLTRDHLEKELKRLEHRPQSLSELVYWLTEKFKSANPKVFNDVVLGSVMQNLADQEGNIDAALGSFLRNWNKLEDRIRKILRAMGHKGSNSEINWRCVVQERQLTEPICELYYNLRLARNRVVHANQAPSLDRLQKMNEDLEQLNRMLKEEYNVE